MTGVFQFLALLCGGVFTGAVITVAWDRTTAWQAMPVSTFTTDFRHALARMDPAMPVLAVITIVATAVSAATTSGTPRLLGMVALILLLAVLGVSIVVLVPINTLFRDTTAGHSPAAGHALRDRWIRIHRVRAAASTVAFACLVASVVTG